MSHGLRRLGELVVLLDYWSQFALVDEFAQSLEIGMILLGQERGQPLFDEWGQGQRSQLPVEAASPLAAFFAPDDDNRASGGERLSQFGQR